MKKDAIMDEKSSKVKNDPKEIKGVVTARKCDCCGHHEIGIITQSGKYVPLRPGMTVNIIGGNSD